MADLTNPIFHDDAKAREHLEALRWPDGPYWPRCGETEKVKRLGGKAGQKGQVMCNACRKKFTVTVGTLFEGSHIPLHKWVLAFHLMAASKKGMSAHQLHRMLGITYKTAWFMAHRIREAMRSTDSTPFGGDGGIVEVDETYIGTKVKLKGKKAGYGHKNAVLTLVDRNGPARSFHVSAATKKDVLPIVRANLDKEARVVTDGSGLYYDLDEEYTHAFVDHSKGQWGRGEIHTNTIEGFFSIFKRGMRGIYQHCGEQHLQRYLFEFDFRYNHRKIEDAERAAKALQGITGKRLTYRRPH